MTDAEKPALEIEYCASCGYLPRALWVAQEVMGDLQFDLAHLRIVPAMRGEFEVRFAGSTIFSKLASGRFPDPLELKQAIFDAMEAAA